MGLRDVTLFMVAAGTSPQLAMEWLKQLMKFDMVSVPYKNAAQATTDVIAGHIPTMFSNVSIFGSTSCTTCSSTVFSTT